MCGRSCVEDHVLHIENYVWKIPGEKHAMLSKEDSAADLVAM